MVCITCYVDADFAGNWTADQALDPRACLSRTGLVIFHANCPVVWQPKLQSTVSLSTTEAEHVALPTAMRDVICSIHLIEEIKEAGTDLPTLHVLSRKFLLATNDTPRTNFEAIELVLLRLHRPISLAP